MNKAMLQVAAATTLLTLGGAVESRAQVPANVSPDRVRIEAAPPRDVVWQEGPPRRGPGELKPNIVVILVDDMGANDVSFNGGGVANGAVKTPHIDSIGRQGVSFAQGYAGHATCAPSRAALLTGRYSTRFGFEYTPVPLAFARSTRAHHFGIFNPVYFPEREKDIIPYSEMGLPESEITIAQLLQRGGYHTIHLGKWHLGGSPKFQPQNRGFSESLGFTGGSSMYLPKTDPRVVNSMQGFDPIDMYYWNGLPFYVRKDGGEAFEPKRHMTDYLTDEAIAAIEANRNRPFFMYLAYSAPHTPLQATREYYDALPHIKDHRLRVYGAMIMQLDRSVGRVLQALQESGLEKDTLVIFATDNGGARYVGLPDLNRPYRGWKSTFFEGGLIGPYFMRWPRVIPSGVVYRAPVSHFDVFATAAAAAGVSVPRDRKMDGKNLVPYVLGERTGRPHEALFWRTGGYRVVRAGDWKLQVTERPAKDWLYDLSIDPTERNNVANERPEKVAELKVLLERHNAEQVESLWPELGQQAVMLDTTLDVPQSPDDEYIYWGN